MILKWILEKHCEGVNCIMNNVTKDRTQWRIFRDDCDMTSRSVTNQVSINFPRRTRMEWAQYAVTRRQHICSDMDSVSMALSLGTMKWHGTNSTQGATTELDTVRKQQPASTPISSPGYESATSVLTKPTFSTEVCLDLYLERIQFDSRSIYHPVGFCI